MSRRKIRKPKKSKDMQEWRDLNDIKELYELVVPWAQKRGMDPGEMVSRLGILIVHVIRLSSGSQYVEDAALRKVIDVMENTMKYFKDLPVPGRSVH